MLIVSATLTVAVLKILESACTARTDSDLDSINYRRHASWSTEIEKEDVLNDKFFSQQYLLIYAIFTFLQIFLASGSISNIKNKDIKTQHCTTVKKYT